MLSTVLKSKVAVDVTISIMRTFTNNKFINLDDLTREQILVEAKYYHYIDKQKKQINSMKNMMSVKIPENFAFEKVSGLSNEIVEKFKKFNPPTLFSASQISGVTPSAIDILYIYIKYKENY